MGDKHNIFISWSGSRSKWAAEALRDWLKVVLQAAKPWMSDTDIEKGARGLDELGKALEGMKIGIICLTPENLSSAWILFEAGALSKTLDAKTRVCTYLLADLQPQDVKTPLGMFQWTKATKDDTRKLLHSINASLDTEPVPEADLDTLFDGMWPRLEEKLAALPKSQEIVATKRSTDEMVAEILEITRAEANRKKKADFIEQYIPFFQQLLPLLPEVLKQARVPRAELHPGDLPGLDVPPYDRMVDAIRAAAQNQKFLWSILDHAMRWEFNGNELRVIFPRESHALAEMLQAKDPMERFRAIVNQVAGTPVKISVEITPTQ